MGLSGFPNGFTVPYRGSRNKSGLWGWLNTSICDKFAIHIFHRADVGGLWFLVIDYVSCNFLFHRSRSPSSSSARTDFLVLISGFVSVVVDMWHRFMVSSCYIYSTAIPVWKWYHQVWVVCLKRFLLVLPGPTFTDWIFFILSLMTETTYLAIVLGPNSNLICSPQSATKIVDWRNCDRPRI